jgi:hypothetical protein
VLAPTGRRPRRSARAAADIPTRIRALEAEIARLRAELDRDDGRFLATVAASVQGHVFTAAELMAHARHDEDLRRVLGETTPKRLGKRLGRLAGRDHGGYTLACVDRDECGCIWDLRFTGEP